LDEAKTLVRFSGKKGIVQINDMFEENNTSYFVMDYIEGTSLSSLVKQNGRLTEQVAINYMLQVLEALTFVHAEGILHRDLKPDNLIVRNTDKQIILIDFGIAREYVENETITHTAMLSVGYAPPEQKDTRAKRTASVDLYSVGAVLYFCLTGQRPQTTDEIATDDYLSAKSLNPAISPAMNSLIDKAIAKKPANRFQTCEEMIAALKNLQGTTPTQKHEQAKNDDTIIGAEVVQNAKPHTKPQNNTKNEDTNRTPIYIGVGIAVLLLLGLVLWQPWKTVPSPSGEVITQNTTPAIDTAGILTAQAQKEKEQQAAQQAQAQKEKEENERADNTAWQQAQQTNTKASYQAYLSSYPNGLHATEAKKAMKAFDLPVFNYEMVYVQGGSYKMGYDPNRDGEDKNMDASKPLHTVSVGSFYIGKYEVTQAQWKEIMGYNPSHFKNCDNCPVGQVNWENIQTFLKKLNTL
jgi:serine/threonine protein kinase